MHKNLRALTLVGPTSLRIKKVSIFAVLENAINTTHEP